jgi:poly(beta-D-mannuronate) C5 epimerase
VVATTLGVGLIAAFVWGRTYTDLALKKQPFQRLTAVPSFDPIEDATLGLPPDATNRRASTPTASIRAIVVNPTQTVMLAGGKAFRTIDVMAPKTLNDLVRVIDNASWASRTGTRVTLNAAVIVENGSVLSVAAPATSELVLTARQGVFLAVSNGELSFDRVYVHASDPFTPQALGTATEVDRRPFVLAVAHAYMTIKDSTFRYLGRDWNASYGVSWSKGATGSATGSLFEHDFIGVYANASVGLRVANCKFYRNSLYGVDPHSGSTDLIIEYNVSDFNGRHGIIFSDHVTNSVVQGNSVRGNGLNGIMMDEASSGNVIAHNTVVGNRSDGIVLADSDDNSVAHNVVSGNRIGISARGSTQGASVAHNTVTHNRKALAGSFAGSGNALSNNGDEWSRYRLERIALGDAALAVVLCLITGVANVRRRQAIRRQAPWQFPPTGAGAV